MRVKIWKPPKCQTIGKWLNKLWHTFYWLYEQDSPYAYGAYSLTAINNKHVLEI